MLHTPTPDSRGVSQTDDPVFMKLLKCNEYPISQSQYYQWRDQFLAHASHAFEVQQHGRQEVRLAQEHARLKKRVGELTLELKKSDELRG
jgi:transposase-like protein